MRNFLILLCLLATTAFCQTVTVIGNPGNIKLNRYPVDVRQFKVAKGTKLASPDELKFCEALDNSLLVIFCVKTTGWESIFSSPNICNSFMEALRRGCTVYIGPQDESTLGCVGKHTYEFFRKIGSYPWTRANYRNLPKTSNGKSQAETGFPWLNEKITISSVVHLGNIEKRPWKPLFKDKNGCITSAVQENVLGKGTIIFSTGLDVHNKAGHPLIDALIRKAFGELKQVGLGQKKKMTAVELPKTFLFLQNGKGTITLSSPKSKEKTDVDVQLQGSLLKLTYHCLNTVPAEAPAKVLNRDGDIWNDNCVELFIGASQKKSGDFYQFIINNGGAIYDSKNGNRGWNADSVKAAVSKNDKEWTVAFSVDLADLGLKDADFFYANFSRTSHAPKAYLLWNEKAGNLANLKGLGIISKLSPQKVTNILSSAAARPGLLLAQLPFPTRMYIDSEAPADAKESLKEIRLFAPMNTKEPAQVGLYNGEINTEVVRFEAPDFLDGPGRPRAWDVFTVKEGVPVLDMMGTIHLDSLARLNESCSITIPPGEARLLWLEADTSKLKPGIYKWNVEFVHTMQPKLPVKSTIILEVVNWRMPDDFGFFLAASGPYDYSWSRGKIREYWKLCKKYHFTQIMISLIPQKPFIKLHDGTVDISDRDEDFVTVEKELTEMGFSCWVYSFGIIGDFNKMMKKLGGKPFKTPEGKKLFTKWVTNYARALRNAGIDLKRAYCPMVDEPRSQDIDMVIEAAKITKAAGFQIYSDFATWSTVDDIRRYAPYCDRIAPWEPRLLTRQTAKEELDVVRKSGKEWVTYLCSPAGNQQPLLEYYRLRGFRSYLLKSCGFEMWAFNSWRGNDWEAMRPKKDKAGTWLVQHGNSGPMPTMRLEAFFEGARDLCLLRCAAASPSPEVRALCSESLIRKMADEQDLVKLNGWRVKLLRTLAK